MTVGYGHSGIVKDEGIMKEEVATGGARTF